MVSSSDQQSTGNNRVEQRQSLRDGNDSIFCFIYVLLIRLYFLPIDLFTMSFSIPFLAIPNLEDTSAVALLEAARQPTTGMTV